MRLTVRLRHFAGQGRDNRTHFLLDGAVANFVVSFEAAPSVTVPAAKTAQGTFVADISSAVVPNRVGPGGAPVLENGQPSKQVVTRIELEFIVRVTLGGLTFQALRVQQRLSPTLRAPADRMTVDYALTPASWRDDLGNQRLANAAVHPLLDATGLRRNELIVNTLMLDITPGWRLLHRDNRLYKVWQTLSPRELTFKVFAHTAGDPLIWYSIVPGHLRGSLPVSPHIFLQPSDNREGQSPRDQKRYLTANDEYFKSDGYTLMKYLIPPLPDEKVAGMGPPLAEPKRLRNVVNFDQVTRNGRPTNEITPRHWAIGAGMQRAFEHVGSGVPAQFMLVPQRIGERSSSLSESYGGAVNGHVTSITAAIFGLLESNTDLTSSGRDAMLTRGKIVYSGFSESGFDLWNLGAAVPDLIKAIIGIEPQNITRITNDYRPIEAGSKDRIGPPPKTGTDVIPALLKRGVRVVIIGRHHSTYAPDASLRARLTLLPKETKVFNYPPDPAVNDFVKYRVQRILSPADDPLMLQEEADILADLARRGITGARALAAVFPAEANDDSSSKGPIEHWYSHQFALSGGEEITLDPSGLYGKPIKYRTFFQQAVHLIG